MVSNNLAHSAHDSQPQTPPQKKNIRSGSILWLRKRLDEDEMILLEAAGLERQALNHPVVVVDLLKKDPEVVKICTMTSCGDRNITMSRIDRKYWHFYLPVQPTPSHPSYTTEPLSLENNKQLRKLSYINTRRTYRISLALLKRYDDLEEGISSHHLTPESLETVKTACGLAPSPRTESRDPVIYATPKTPPTTPWPSSKQHTHNLLYAAATEYNVEDNTGRYRVPADEHEPLLPVPVTNTLQNSQAQFPPAWPGQHQTHQGRVANDYYYVHRRPKKTHYEPILSALLTLLCICACVVLLATLGYSLFLGIMWVFRVFTSLVTTTEAELVRLGHYIAHVGGYIVSPFITVGKAVSAGWKSLVHVLKEIVRWFDNRKTMSS
ncbi:hypothetical protein EPUS_06950 [Endocarpon pusillum Z07020]|uniref:Uncharacterized protein n=1 Tax=Endocarpon pusillum (strain Z07020 / HMAS-L-300199) TaxID=1263415 RepID=U1GFG7_ENDPU|nr:uncharacterized protein EPUS_06950 [Endocarpon pusillum Z07020]ERF76392.1 hypothetical protein EPUS_06950 [Endocarpon pusillum Z07020]